MKRTCSGGGCLGDERFAVNNTLSTSFAMDAWELYAERAFHRTAVRSWAELEGKSPQMAEDLLRPFATKVRWSHKWQVGLALGAKLLAWAAEAWWHFTRP